MEMLECAAQHCLRAKAELVSAYVLAYANEFNEVNKKNDEVMFSISRFKTLIENTQNYRHGVRRSVEVANEPAEASGEQEANCCLL